MKRRFLILTSIIAAALFVSACGGTAQKEEAPAADMGSSPESQFSPTPDHSPSLDPSPAPSSELRREPRSSVSEAVNVVFIGGSITEGAAATPLDQAWSYLVADWLEQYYQQGINSRNIAVSGTNSQYATFRVERDLVGFIPDLVFIEFAVNDPMDRVFVVKHMDALVYKLRAINPDVVLVSVATTASWFGASVRNGQEPYNVEFSREAAEQNNLIYIDVGSALWQQVLSESLAITSYLPDGVHPNNQGHRLYADAVISALEPQLIGAKGLGQTTTTLMASGLEHATIQAASTVSDHSCVHQTIGLVCELGQSFQFDFSGSVIGLELMKISDGGQMTCSVDDGGQTRVAFWDRFAQSYDRLAATMLFDELAEGQHRLSCQVNSTVLREGSAESSGHKAVIVGLMVAE
ncbi:SGNH/GDSL hydrolase family protein [Agaribacterium sp. ZY112]|uniref:SGNH/GDSL hydrolase family protein n=1 Tax=Agaribacterium sp. ZY112 TaxID=3233574 RepID=UPI003524774E